MSSSLQCVTCIHYTGALTCAAFPDEIPPEIVTGEHDHLEPYKGDQGIRYEHNPDSPPDPSLEEDFDELFDGE